MFLVESLKKTVAQVTGYGSPSRAELRDLIRPRKATAIRLPANGLVPNNPSLPLIVYRTPVRLLPTYDPAAIFEALFAKNGWTDSWRNGIYDYVHYHSGTHEVLGIARGTACVQFGGSKGRKLNIKAGDVVILPAGTGHRRLRASKDLLVVGAYSDGKYDECRPTKKNYERALISIPKVADPKRDPVYG